MAIEAAARPTAARKEAVARYFSNLLVGVILSHAGEPASTTVIRWGEGTNSPTPFAMTEDSTR